MAWTWWKKHVCKNKDKDKNKDTETDSNKTMSMSVAMGADADSSSDMSMAMGADADSSSDMSMAMSADADSSFDVRTAMGTDADSSSDVRTAMSTDANPSADIRMALSADASTSADVRTGKNKRTGKGNGNVSQQNINNAALAHLEQKYGKTFEYIAPWGSSYSTPGMRQILVSCDALPDREILVVITDDGDSTFYSDNYMDFLYESETLRYIKQVAGRFFEDITVAINIIRAPSADGIIPETSFQDYILNKGQIIDAEIVADHSNETTVRAFLAELIGMGIHFSFDIDIPSNNDCYTAQFFHGDSDVFLERRALR